MLDAKNATAHAFSVRAQANSVQAVRIGDVAYATSKVTFTRFVLQQNIQRDAEDEQWHDHFCAGFVILGIQWMALSW